MKKFSVCYSLMETKESKNAKMKFIISFDLEETNEDNSKALWLHHLLPHTQSQV